MRSGTGLYFPSRPIMHCKKLPDRHFYLAFSRHTDSVSFFIHRPRHFSHAEIFFPELLLHVRIYVGHNLVLFLLYAPPEANGIGILKEYAFIVRIKRKIYNENKKKQCPCNEKRGFQCHIPFCGFSYKHTTTPIPKSRNGRKGISLSRPIFFRANKTAATADSAKSPANRIRKHR